MTTINVDKQSLKFCFRKIMKKFLPTSGFTLIELLVVVAILAILSVIGYSIFAGAQGNTRDGVRRTELNNLGKNVETSKDVTGGFPLYKYTGTQFGADYPQVKPKDPAISATAPLYCVATSTGVTPPTTITDPTTWSVTDPCPTNTAQANATTWRTLVDSTGTYNTGATGSTIGTVATSCASGTPGVCAAIGAAPANGLMTGARAWKICARLETSGKIVCQGNLQ